MKKENNNDIDVNDKQNQFRKKNKRQKKLVGTDPGELTNGSG